MAGAVSDKRTRDILYKRLDDAFSDRVKRGSVILHKELMLVLEERERTPRYYSVVIGWAKRYEQRTKVVGRFNRGGGFGFLDHDNQVNHSYGLIRQAGRKTRRARLVSLYVHDDPDAPATTRDRASRVVGEISKLAASMNDSRKAIKMLTAPTPTMPRGEMKNGDSH